MGRHGSALLDQDYHRCLSGQQDRDDGSMVRMKSLLMLMGIVSSARWFELPGGTVPH
jgi:hypothetical protein